VKESTHSICTALPGEVDAEARCGVWILFCRMRARSFRFLLQCHATPIRDTSCYVAFCHVAPCSFARPDATQRLDSQH